MSCEYVGNGCTKTTCNEPVWWTVDVGSPELWKVCDKHLGEVVTFTLRKNFEHIRVDRI